MTHQMLLILDFGSQYTQLIARRVRAMHVYCEIVPFNQAKQAIADKNPTAIILSGSPFSVNSQQAPLLDKDFFNTQLPVLGICYGMQLMVHSLGGKVERAEKKEYGYANITIDNHSSIFAGLNPQEDVWMSHGDAVAELPEGFARLAHTGNSPWAAIAHKSKKMYALQFHPEVVNTKNGARMLENFINIAGFSKDWTADSYIETEVARLQKQTAGKSVILGLSGGVDSSVTAALLYKAIGKKLIPIFVDTGLLRKNEVTDVQQMFADAFGLELITISAAQEFYTALKGVSEPEQKRKIIGRLFVEIFEREAQKYPDAEFLAQGTLYPDVIESVSFKGPSATIKSHHNVGGLPERMNLKLVEPLRELFKDEVREVGLLLGLPARMVHRHPFPGPGLGIRILGDITPQRVKVLQEIDYIFISELHANDLYKNTWQAFAVLLPVSSVGVMGDERTYENVCALRAVDSLDGMTADWTEFPHWFLKKVSSRIINEVTGVNRVVYDISSKPPATIEWE